jgi:hypothetical protein
MYCLLKFAIIPSENEIVIFLARKYGKTKSLTKGGPLIFHN